MQLEITYIKIIFSWINFSLLLHIFNNTNIYKQYFKFIYTAINKLENILHINIIVRYRRRDPKKTRLASIWWLNNEWKRIARSKCLFFFLFYISYQSLARKMPLWNDLTCHTVIVLASPAHLLKLWCWEQRDSLKFCLNKIYSVWNRLNDIADFGIKSSKLGKYFLIVFMVQKWKFEDQPHSGCLSSSWNYENIVKIHKT